MGLKSKAGCHLHWRLQVSSLHPHEPIMKQTKIGQLCQQFTYACRYTKVISLCFPCNQVASLDMVLDCVPGPPAFSTFTCCDDPAERALGRQGCSHTHLHTSLDWRRAMSVSQRTGRGFSMWQAARCRVGDQYGFSTCVNNLTYASSLKSRVQRNRKVILRPKQVCAGDQPPFQSWHSPFAGQSTMFTRSPLPVAKVSNTSLGQRVTHLMGSALLCRLKTWNIQTASTPGEKVG